MPNEFDHKIWGVSDFKRYYLGTMPDTERHALEKAALEDPFLQDALDGYSQVPEPEQDLVEISERIWPVKQKRTPVIWYKTMNMDMVWKAAAVFIIVGGLTWLIVSNRKETANQNSGDNFAGLEKSKADDSAELNAQFDSVISQSENSNPVAVLEQQPGATKPPFQIPAQSSAEAPATPVDDESLTRVEYNRSDAVKLKKEQATLNDALAGKVAGMETHPVERDLAKKDIALEPGVIKGRVVDVAGQPVPHANVMLQYRDEKQGVAADANGYFSLNNVNASNEKVQIQANATGYETTNVALANNTSNNNIVLAPQENTLSEVVITKVTPRKRNIAAASSATKKANVTKWTANNSRVLLKGAVPLSGWDHFYSFMHDSTNMLNNSFMKKGEVVLRFNIDSAGKAMDVKLTRSLTGAADTLSKTILGQSPPLRILNKNRPAEARFIFK